MRGAHARPPLTPYSLVLSTVKRDIAERGRDVQGIIKQYDMFVKPAFEDYIWPSKKHADIIIPRAGANTVAINLIVEHIRNTLRARGATFTNQLMPEAFNARSLPSLHVLPDNNQVRGLHTIIRNKATPRSDFVFYTNRLTRLLIEEALGCAARCGSVVFRLCRSRPSASQPAPDA